MNFEGKDLVAIAAIAVSGVLIYMGHDGAIITFLGTIIGWYFGTKKSEKE